MSHEGNCYCPNCDRSFDRDAIEAENARLRRFLDDAEQVRDQRWQMAKDAKAALYVAESERDDARKSRDALSAARADAERRAQALDFELESWVKLGRLREEGWSVAVHNDYRLKGRPFTFWLFTRADGRWIKGEGATDAEAIAVAWASFYEMAHPGDAREDSADNHRGEEGYER